MKSINTFKAHALEYFLDFCVGASWGLFVVWIIFPPFRAFGLLIDRIISGVIALIMALCFTLLLNKIAKND